MSVSVCARAGRQHCAVGRCHRRVVGVGERVRSHARGAGPVDGEAADREPGADEGEGGLPFGPWSTEKAPAESSEIPAYLNRATSIEDLSVRWLNCQALVAKAGSRMQEAFKKLRDDREKALKGGTK